MTETPQTQWLRKFLPDRKSSDERRAAYRAGDVHIVTNGFTTAGLRLSDDAAAIVTLDPGWSAEDVKTWDAERATRTLMQRYAETETRLNVRVDRAALERAAKLAAKAKDTLHLYTQPGRRALIARSGSVERGYNVTLIAIHPDDETPARATTFYANPDTMPKITAGSKSVYMRIAVYADPQGKTRAKVSTKNTLSRGDLQAGITRQAAQQKANAGAA